MLTRIACVVIPLIVMTMAIMMVLSNLENTSFSTAEVSVNKSGYGGQNSVSTGTILWDMIIAVVIISGVFVSLAVAASLQVFGSGLSGEGPKMILVYGVGMTMWGALTGISIPLFLSIPYFGIPFYFGLSIMYLFGLVGLASGGGGD
jgi:hypothetical protein